MYYTCITHATAILKPMTNPTETKNPSPISLRLDETHQKTLNQLSLGSSPSDVLRKGLRMVASSELSAGAPLYARLVDEPEIEEAVEEAMQAAVDVLDRLFPQKGPEKFGISSNFQGVLKEHITAMLTGKASARSTHSRALNALFGDWKSLGQVRSAGPQEGYSVVQLPVRHGDDPMYYHSDKKRFVPLATVGADTLFTSEDAALKDVFTWMKSEELSPREVQLKLCVLSFAHDGPLQVVAVAD